MYVCMYENVYNAPLLQPKQSRVLLWIDTLFILKKLAFMTNFKNKRTVLLVLLCFYKNSGDEIANVNFYAVRSGSYRNSLK